MQRILILTAAEQAAAQLRGQIQKGVWSGSMPGGDKLAAAMGIGCNTAEAALTLLEQEGLLKNQGRRRGRLIIPQPVAAAGNAFRVAILLSESANAALDYIVEIRRELAAAGHTCYLAPKSMEDLGMDANRIARMAKKTECDAWLVIGGSSELLAWFETVNKPVFALFGRQTGKRVAGTGPDKRAALRECVRMLLAHGHRRIVLMARPRRRLPKPGLLEQSFLDELSAHGQLAGEYNLPAWEETPAGFHAKLDALFHITPPTALIIQEAPLFFAALQFLAQRRLATPGDVSLVCTDHSPDFDWCQPAISHIRWDSRPLIRHLFKWAAHVSHGKVDVSQTKTHAAFVPGGTIGPVAGGR
jgi:hypothetical protein